MSNFLRIIFPMKITKKIYTFNILLILIPLIALTVGLQVYSYKEERITNEKTLRAVAQLLNEALPGSFTEILEKNDALKAPLNEQVLVINRELQPIISKMQATFPDVGMGYYSLELDRRVAFGPNFTPYHLTALPHDGIYQKVYATGKPSIKIFNNSIIFRGKTTLGYSYPLRRDGKVIGHIFTNIKLSDIYLKIAKNLLVFLLLSVILLTLSVWYSRRLFTGFKRDLALFSEALTTSGSPQPNEFLPELNPIIDLVQQQTGEKEKTIQKLVTEVKKRKSIQKKLLQVKEKITTILDTVTDAFFTLDSNWRFTYINDEAQRLFTALCADFKGKSIKEIPDFAIPLKNLRKSYSQQSKICCEIYNENLQRWFEINVYFSGKVLGVYIKDITPRKQADSKIAFQAAVMNQVRNIVIVTDLEEKVVYWNKAAEAASQWTDKEITGAKNVEMFLATESIKLRREMHQIVLKNGHWEGEIIFKRKDGSYLPLHLVTASIKDTVGQTIGIVCVGTDMTERKKIEKEMIRLDRLDLVGEMAAGIGHEVRNPMTTVRGLLQLLLSKETNPEKLDYFALMIQELDRANSIITEYLSLAKNKRVTLKMQSLNSIVTNLLPLLQAGAIVANKTVTTQLDNIPNILVDEKEIQQMILNLVRNGLDAMSIDGILTIKTYTDDQDVVLEVEDHGSGIDPQIIDRLGTPFVTSKDGGTGLGLAVSYSIANRQNAKISFSTSPKGTTFYVRFSEAARTAANKRVILTAV